MTLKELTERVKALEAEIASMKNKLTHATDPSSPQAWLENSGRFKHDPVFEEIVRRGREYRETTGEKRKRKKKAVSDQI
jgi:hypothetical protein